ncbi:MAG: hypothetical protein AAFW00_24150 [Bacteroidota bacterium]
MRRVAIYITLVLGIFIALTASPKVSDNSSNLLSLENNLEIELSDDVVVKFKGAKRWKSQNIDASNEDSISIDIFFDPYKLSFQIINNNPEILDCKVTQRCQTTLLFSDGDGHILLKDWKHFYSNWEELNSNSSQKFNLLNYSEEDLKFPDYTINELIEAIQKYESEYMPKSKIPFSYVFSDKDNPKYHFVDNYISTLDLNFYLKFNDTVCNKFVAFQITDG